MNDSPRLGPSIPPNVQISQAAAAASPPNSHPAEEEKVYDVAQLIFTGARPTSASRRLEMGRARSVTSQSSEASSVSSSGNSTPAAERKPFRQGRRMELDKNDLEFLNNQKAAASENRSSSGSFSTRGTNDANSEESFSWDQALRAENPLKEPEKAPTLRKMTLTANRLFAPLRAASSNAQAAEGVQSSAADKSKLVFEEIKYTLFKDRSIESTRATFYGKNGPEAQATLKNELSGLQTFFLERLEPAILSSRNYEEYLSLGTDKQALEYETKNSPPDLKEGNRNRITQQNLELANNKVKFVSIDNKGDKEVFKKISILLGETTHLATLKTNEKSKHQIKGLYADLRGMQEELSHAEKGSFKEVALKSMIRGLAVNIQDTLHSSVEVRKTLTVESAKELIKENPDLKKTISLVEQPGIPAEAINRATVLYSIFKEAGGNPAEFLQDLESVPPALDARLRNFNFENTEYLAKNVLDDIKVSYESVKAKELSRLKQKAKEAPGLLARWRELQSQANSPEELVTMAKKTPLFNKENVDNMIGVMTACSQTGNRELAQAMKAMIDLTKELGLHKGEYT